MKKSQFDTTGNGKADFGTIVLSTFAQRHS